jgi:Carboxypeptidase regulatory-like domain/TonB dependent receptor-like, beta-barrel
MMRRKMLFLVVMLLCAFSARAQYRASIQGVVTDPAGAVVSGATLTLTNLDTNQKLTATSDGNGVYNFNALPSAKFSLAVEKAGFKKKVLENLGIIPEQANALNIQLELGQVTESVTVSGDSTPLMDTETASINGVVNSNQIQHMPSFGRDVLKLAQLAPGSFADGSQGGGSGDSYNIPGISGQTGGGQSGGADGIFKTENGAPIISNGQQATSNGISIDGISTSSAVWGGSTIITPSEDSVDSVKIVTNSYDAEDGRFSGTQIQIISKSGTNDIHGSLFITTHQPGLNAYQRFNGANLKPTKDANKFEQFGGSVGGPIWKNKIFAFFNYETVREPFSPQQGNGWYETPAFAALAPAGSIASKYLSFPGNGVVGTLNPNATCADAGLTEGVNCKTIPGQGLNVGTPLTTGLGTQDLGWTSNTNPGCGGAGTGCGTPGSPLGTVADIANYNTINPTKFTATQYNGRLDGNVTGKDQLIFAIYWVPLSKDNFNGSNRAYNIFHHNQINKALSAAWNHTFSPTLLNEIRVNAANWNWNEITSNPQAPVGFPTDRFETTGNITLNNFGPSVGSELNQWTYTYKDVATKIYGRHTIKFGGELTRLFYLQECAGCGVPNYAFFNIWDFLNDAPHSEGGSFNPVTGFPTTFRQDDRQSIWGLFVQDDFKLRRNLTINLGLRWSYFGPLSSKQGNMFRAFPGVGANYLTGLVVKPGHSWDAQKDNFGPQIGVAWSPSRFKDRLAVRGGYGLSYTGVESAVSSSIFQNPGLFVFPGLSYSNPTTCGGTQTLANNCGIVYALSSSPNALGGYPANPFTVSSFGANGLPTTGSVGVQIFPNTMPTTRVHHYSADLQYDLGHQLVASLGYQGSISRDTNFHENPLAVPATKGFALNPQINGGDFWSFSGRGNYNALLAELKHQFSHGLMADGQFTWSKCMDTSSAPYTLQPYPFNSDLDYGRCDYNVGKALKLFGVWQPVFFHGSGWKAKVIDGWSLSGIFNIHSGFPWTPVVDVTGNNTYCSQCGYNLLFPANYLGGAGSSTSIDSFKTVAQSNFPKGGAAYFSPTTYPAGMFGTTLPPAPGVQRNSWNLPGYKAVDLTLAKGFGLPKARVLGENARIELRMDVYNLFNNLNLDPNQISKDTSAGNFGTITGALAARVVTLGARFNF